jgi:hypothetical protein
MAGNYTYPEFAPRCDIIFTVFPTTSQRIFRFVHSFLYLLWRQPCRHLIQVIQQRRVIMVYHVASGDIVSGKEKAAEQWLLKVAAYQNNRFPSAKAEILRNINGPDNRAHYTDSWESLGAWESASKQLDADSDWQALFTDVDSLIVPGTVQHNFYRVVSA